MIEEQIEVIEVIGNQLILQARTKSACGGCAVNKGCGTSLLSKVVGKKFTRFKVDNTVNADVGDMVVVGISEDALLKGSLMAYILPIVFMLVIALIADVYLPSTIGIRDLMIAGLSIIGFFGGFYLSKSYFQSSSTMKHFSPVVLRKIIGHGKLNQ